jgi:transformation/transcription domain-associated protein
MCKNWAYMNVCQFISVFDTPGNIILQVYVALLKAFQHEGRDLVRASISVLMPSLKSKLSEEEFEKAIDYTTRIMYEEGNSMPHMAHIWTIVTTHPEVFVKHRHRFIRHIVNTLNRLGLPPSCPIENRVLSLTLTEQVLDWSEDVCDTTVVSEERLVSGKRDSSDYKDDILLVSPAKKLRSSQSKAVGTVPESDEAAKEFVFDQSMVSSFARVQ